MVDVKKIDLLLVEQEKKNKDLAAHMGITVQALNKKKRGRSKWTIEDAENVLNFLGVTDPAEKVLIFLT